MFGAAKCINQISPILTKSCSDFLIHQPVWRPSLAILVDVQQEFRGVHWGGSAGVQEQLLMLGQVLSWVLLRQPCTVQQLPLKERQVGLQKETSVYY